MFETLTRQERRRLAARLRHAGQELAEEANTLATAPPSVLAAYDLPRDRYHAFYEASIEASLLSIDVLREVA